MIANNPARGQLNTIFFSPLHGFLKKNQSTPRPSEHPPVIGEKMSKRLGGIKGCKYKICCDHVK